VARLRSVNVARPRTTEWQGRQVTSGIWKEPVTGRVGVRGVNVDGDEQADLRVHGGPDKAVYAYAWEDYEWWAVELGEPLAPGTFGENLTVEGVDLGATTIGTVWRIGELVLEVTEPRIPCFKLSMRMGDAGFAERFKDAERNGGYLTIVEPGEIGAGDEIEIVSTPRSPTLHAIALDYYRR
jgi:MOSC domain-containing protein YiiM